MKKILTALLVCFSLALPAQNLPFKNEIMAFKASDSVEMPPKRAIVFVGSSSFRMWKSMAEAFPRHVVINRGFGGSRLPHIIAYADEIVIPYKPKQVVIYCGENDFMNDTVTSEIVTERFKTLFHLLREALPGSRIVFVSIKPSPSRQALMPKMASANKAIKGFLGKQRRAVFVDIWDDMLDANGMPREELFLKDMLHMNAEGYAIWQSAIEPHLKK